MERAEFTQRVRFALRCDPQRRHILLAALHGHALGTYLHAVHRIDEPAARLIGRDGRSIAAVVAHIAAWDRWTGRALDEICSGEERPGILDLRGYAEEEGRPLRFDSIDAFNGHVVATVPLRPWTRIREEAVALARAIHDRFVEPALLRPDRLSATVSVPWTDGDGRVVDLPAGWLLWVKTIEHQGVAHIVDLETAAAIDRLDGDEAPSRMVPGG
jgi:hypothetical protein